MSQISTLHRLAFIVLTLAAIAASHSSGAATVAISPVPSQTVKGWGSFPSYFRGDWSATHQFDIFNKPAIQDALYGVGVTFIRVDVEPRLYTSGTTVDDIVLNQGALHDLLAQLKIARDHGVAQYIMSSWSPPAVWKEPQQTINGKSDAGFNPPNATEHLKTEFNGAYVAYYTKVLLSLKTNGAGLPLAISVQNEPDIVPGYDGCYYMDRISQWRDIVKAMRASFDAHGLTRVLINGPECASMDFDAAFLGGGGWPDLTQDAALNHAVGAAAFHSYGEFYWTGARDGLIAHPRDVYITEWCIDSGRYGDSEMDHTIATMRHFASNFVDLPINYWSWWNSWSGGSDLPGGGSLVQGDSSPIFSKRYWLFQKIWTTVRPGWVVKHVTCDDPAFRVSNIKNTPYKDGVIGDTFADFVAFESPKASQSTILLINSTSTAAKMTITGLHGATQTTYQTDDTHDVADISHGLLVSGSVDVTLPPRSQTVVITQPKGITSHLPAVPTGLTVKPYAGFVSLFWTPSHGALTYNVKSSTAAGGPYTLVASPSTPGYTHPGLTKGATYYYVVSAVNGRGESGNSKEISVEVK